MSGSTRARRYRMFRISGTDSYFSVAAQGVGHIEFVEPAIGDADYRTAIGATNQFGFDLFHEVISNAKVQARKRAQHGLQRHRVWCQYSNELNSRGVSIIVVQHSTKPFPAFDGAVTVQPRM